ncbi:cell division protein FtsL [Brevundimonas sp.]|uniref:cell division protein FtsL n=1 Tax=Brevundimonas sp. TaxID=1871086 RepID=UPI002FC96FE2
MNPVLASLKRLFDWRVRGVRVIELVSVVCLAAVMVSVYIVKTAAARESTEISSIEREIGENEKRVRLLRAEATRLEQPARLEALSRQFGLEPVKVQRRADEDGLAKIAAEHQPPAPVVTATVPAAPAAVPAVQVPVQASVQASGQEGQP